MTEKTSPYIFPFRPFRHLDLIEPTSKITSTENWEADRFEPLLERFAPGIELPSGGSLAERVLAIFTSDEVLFGENSFIESKRDYWLAKIESLIAEGRAIEFTILGYPFKMPVPLKTNRRCADFGEAVSLRRLAAIVRAIQGHYAPGAKVHVFTEGPFGAFNGVDRSWSDQYFTSLESLVDSFGVGDCVELHDLNVIADERPDFVRLWAEITEEIRARRDNCDPATLKALNDALPVRFHNLANPRASEDELRRAFIGDESASELRDAIRERAEEGVMSYRAFLEARDRISLLESCVPDALAMTVSPRPGRLGVRPLPAPAEILPYHGVPVLTADAQGMRIEYLWDLMRSARLLTAVNLIGDSDPRPFMYIEV